MNKNKKYYLAKKKIKGVLTTRNIILNYQVGNDTSYPNSGTTLYDLTINGYNASLNGGVTYTTLSGKEVLTLNGSSGYILPPAATAMSDTDSFTFTGWVTARSSGSGIVFARGNDGFGSGWSISTVLTTTTLAFNVVVNGGNRPLSYSVSGVVLNKLYHIGCVYNRTTGKLRVYLDGVFKAEASCPVNGTLRSSTRGMVIGSLVNGNFFAGSIAEFQAYNVALTDLEIESNYLFGLSTYNY